MNANDFITKDYRKNDDFIVRINKPNFQNAKMNVNLTLTKDCRKNDCLAPQKTNPKQTQFKACPERTCPEQGRRSRMGQFPKGQNELKIACRKIRPHSRMA